MHQCPPRLQQTPRQIGNYEPTNFPKSSNPQRRYEPGTVSICPAQIRNGMPIRWRAQPPRNRGRRPATARHHPTARQERVAPRHDVLGERSVRGAAVFRTESGPSDAITDLAAAAFPAPWPGTDTNAPGWTVGIATEKPTSRAPSVNIRFISFSLPHHDQPRQIEALSNQGSIFYPNSSTYDRYFTMEDESSSKKSINS